MPCSSKKKPRRPIVVRLTVFFSPLKMASFRRQLEGFVVVVFAFNLVSLCRTNGDKFGMLCYNVFIYSRGMLSKVVRRVLPNTLSMFPVGKRAAQNRNSWCYLTCMEFKVCLDYGRSQAVHFSDRGIGFCMKATVFSTNV